VRESHFRLISATHKRLDEEVKAGRFREDLYFRLKVVEIQIPPLRERREDILLLVKHFLETKAKELQLPIPSLLPDAERAFLAHSWPGNVRELENEIVQVLLRIDGGEILRRDHLSPRIRKDAGDAKAPLRYASQAFERRYLREALARHGGNRTRTAHALGLTRQSLHRKLRKHGIGIGIGVSVCVMGNRQEVTGKKQDARLEATGVAGVESQPGEGSRRTAPPHIPPPSHSGAKSG
jgi:DNA-binding NtrC family response regulator